jgi:hypothetical protein
MIELQTGWIPYDQLTESQKQLHDANVAKMPAFGLYGDKPEVGFRIILTDLWRHASVVELLGQPFLGWLQDTGCCVGVGGGDAQQSTLLADKIIRKEPEKPVLVLWPYNYGRSRLLGGMRGRGEGSFGSTYAKSASEDGCPDWDGDGLPAWTVKRGMFSIGKQAELAWSDGNYAPQSVREEGKQHKFTSAPLSSADQVRDAICNGYAVTRAGMTFCQPNTARVQGDVLIGSYNGRGGHQESWQGYWNHPVHGELFYEMNQWGADAYAQCPSGAARGGYWMKKSDVDAFCRSQYAEVYAISNYEGYPAKPEVFDWATQSFFH